MSISINNKKLAIFTDNLGDHIDLIEKIKNSTKDYDDFCIFTNNMNISINDYGIINPYYLISYDGLLVFLSVEDYLQYKDSIICDIAIYINDYNGIDRNTLKKCLVLTENGNEILWVNNNELSQII